MRYDPFFGESFQKIAKHHVPKHIIESKRYHGCCQVSERPEAYDPDYFSHGKARNQGIIDAFFLIIGDKSKGLITERSADQQEHYHEQPERDGKIEIGRQKKGIRQKNCGYGSSGKYSQGSLVLAIFMQTVQGYFQKIENYRQKENKNVLFYI